MMEKLKCLYLSFDSASVDIREKVSLSQLELMEFTQRLGEQGFAREFFILSTCNRTEVYYLSEHGRKNTFLQALGQYKNNLQLPVLRDYFVEETDSDKVIERLFKISNGLLSQVLGDSQVIRQVKDAYDIAAQMGSIGPYLHRLLQLVFASHKDISTYTEIHSGNASVSSAAVEMITRLLKNDATRSVLVVGAGKFSIEVIEQLKKRRFSDITITNRNRKNAAKVASRFSLKYIPFNELETTLPYDVIVTCIAAQGVLIKREQVQTSSARLLIDLSVPRVIDPALGNVQGIKLVNMDQITEHNREAHKIREDSIPKVLTIIEAYCEEFKEWEASNMARPVLHDFKNSMEEIRNKEMNRLLKKYKDTAVDLALVEQLTKSIVNKIVKIPAIRLNETGSSNLAEFDKLSNALATLFDLHKMKSATTQR